MHRKHYKTLHLINQKLSNGFCIVKTNNPERLAFEYKDLYNQSVLYVFVKIGIYRFELKK